AFFGGPDAAGEGLHVDLVADAGTGRHHAEVGKVLLCPAQEAVAPAVALELQIEICFDCIGCAVVIDHYGVVDNQVGLDHRHDALRVAAVAGHRTAQRGEVGHQRNPG